MPVSRIGAPLVSSYITDITLRKKRINSSREEWSTAYRPRGSGRPTKRESRELDDFLE
jgi:hypothetical protein